MESIQVQQMLKTLKNWLGPSGMFLIIWVGIPALISWKLWHEKFLTIVATAVSIYIGYLKGHAPEFISYIIKSLIE